MEVSSKPHKRIKKAVTYTGSSKSSYKRSSNKKRKSTVKRESVLRPSLYKNLQKQRKSQLAFRNTITSTVQPQPLIPLPSLPSIPLSIKPDHRRTVFISLRGLFDCWRDVPPHVLFDSIFILPLYRDWIVSPLQYIGYKHDFNDILSDNKFITLLRWKEKQGLVFFMLEAMDINNQLQQRIRHQHDPTQHNIAPFWYHLSSKLQTLYDPDTGNSYKPLLLNERWWKYAYGHKYYSKYNVSSQEILNELYFLTMKFGNIQEILYQSNPTLNVIMIYCETPQLMAIRSILSTKPQKHCVELQMAPKHEEEDIEIDHAPIADIGIQIPAHSDDDHHYLSCDTLQTPSHDSSSSQMLHKQIGEDELKENYDKASSSSSSPSISSSAMAPIMPFGKDIEDSIDTEQKKSFDSRSTNTASRKPTLDNMDMEWWVCPDYYYETYKSKLDTDCDTDYS